MISIIIPVLNEEKTIEKSLKNIKEIEGDYEIIVSDGGSKDRTVEIAERYAKVIISKPGRAIQMNSAAKIAKGSVLWFVHSDSKVEKDSLSAIKYAVDSGFHAGCFSLYFYDHDDKLLKFIAKTSNYRAKYLKLIFGDQGLFIRNDYFRELNGYKEIPIMEDWDISKRIYENGNVIVLDKKIGTSARRFKKGGVLKTLLKMHKIKFQYIMGKSPQDIAKIYREVR
ncbi:MAG: TIGR04283 family arsenosugar biosynthesis glycosyltransferase [Tissierellia bacterium]|nr:TIGR04283 family arsenosugar biosynthesis glycosyltransferase [Tissierellia bacterium]